jgi:molecular chaperone DnaK
MDAAVSSAIKGRTMQSADDKLGQGPAAPHPIAQAEFMERK